MGKITDLINLHKDISDNLSNVDMKLVIDHKKGSFNNIQRVYNMDLVSRFVVDIKLKYDRVSTEIENISHDIQKFLDNINDQIDSLADQLIKSERQQALSVSLRRFGLTTTRRDIPEDIRESIISHSSWQYPGLIMYPFNRSWIDLFTASEPLYLVDYDRNVLLDMIKVYPTIYQNRLRLYPSIDQLPKNQFGVILLWDFLTWLSMDKQFDYINKCYELLRPGGVMIFSYHNCDINTMAKVAENNNICYSSSRRLHKFCRELESNIISDLHIPIEHNLTLSWMKIQKPGTSTSIKLQPPIGEIKKKPIDFIKPIAQWK